MEKVYNLRCKKSHYRLNVDKYYIIEKHVNYFIKGSLTGWYENVYIVFYGDKYNIEKIFSVTDGFIKEYFYTEIEDRKMKLKKIESRL